MAAPYDIPPEMRDFAQRSVAQARKAFEGFIGAVSKTTGTVENVTPPVLTGARDVSAKAVSFAEDNVNAAFDLAERLVQAKSIQEVIELQSEYVKQQLATIQSQTKELGTVVQKASGLDK